MATIMRRVRVANPRRKKRAVANKRRNARRAPAIRRYNVKALKSELKRRGVKLNARPKAAPKRRVRRSNPVLIELGAINPRRKSVAIKRKRRKTSRNPRRRRAVSVARVSRRRNRRVSRRRRRNPMTTTTVRRRTTRVYNRRRYRRRNPAFGRGTLEKGAGILVGVAAVKFLPTLLPANITAMTTGMGGFGPVLITGAGAFVAGWLAERFVKTGGFAEGVFMGGVAQTMSALLNMISPTLAGQLALRGVGDIVPGRYTVPQNPLMLPAPAPMPAANGMGAAAFPRAF